MDHNFKKYWQFRFVKASPGFFGSPVIQSQSLILKFFFANFISSVLYYPDQLNLKTNFQLNFAGSGGRLVKQAIIDID